MFEMDNEAQPLSEYALTTWRRMTDQGLAPLDSLTLIEKQLQRRQKMRPSRDNEQAIRLVGKWRVMVRVANSRIN